MKGHIPGSFSYPTDFSIQSMNYKLFAVLVHSVQIPPDGQYFVFLRKTLIHWIKLSDGQFSEETEHTVLSAGSTVYMLVYVRTGDLEAITGISSLLEMPATSEMHTLQVIAVDAPVIVTGLYEITMPTRATVVTLISNVLRLRNITSEPSHYAIFKQKDCRLVQVYEPSFPIAPLEDKKAFYRVEECSQGRRLVTFVHVLETESGSHWSTPQFLGLPFSLVLQGYINLKELREHIARKMDLDIHIIEKWRVVRVEEDMLGEEYTRAGEIPEGDEIALLHPLDDSFFLRTTALID
ncbi:hypothetical protein Pelo_11147 [Pelomyxa schiedti]|nr:hypothetical protein Pelo_11147 [Pelomyxa schiedti]